MLKIKITLSYIKIKDETHIIELFLDGLEKKL